MKKGITEFSAEVLLNGETVKYWYHEKYTAESAAEARKFAEDFIRKMEFDGWKIVDKDGISTVLFNKDSLKAAAVTVKFMYFNGMRDSYDADICERDLLVSEDGDEYICFMVEGGVELQSLGSGGRPKVCSQEGLDSMGLRICKAYRSFEDWDMIDMAED